MAFVPAHRSPAALIINNGGGDNRYSSHRNFWILIGFIFSIIFIVAIFLASRLFISYLLRRCNLRNRAAAALPASQAPAAAVVTAAGLDPRAVAALPTFSYRRHAGDGGGLCAVCLCAAEESEVMRVLPYCKHFFHVECIGEWLRSHPTCPVCRADVRLRRAAAGKREGGGGRGRSGEEGSSTSRVGKVVERRQVEGEGALDSEAFGS